MSEIDIDGLGEAELYELSGRIYDRIAALERKRAGCRDTAVVCGSSLRCRTIAL
jgi:hypothetical protein